MSFNSLKAQLMPEIQSEANQMSGQTDLQTFLQQLVKDPTKSALWGPLSSLINQSYDRQERGIMQTMAGTGQLRSGNIANSMATLGQGRDMALADTAGTLSSSAIGQLLGLNEFNTNVGLQQQQLSMQGQGQLLSGLGSLAGLLLAPTTGGASLLPYLMGANFSQNNPSLLSGMGQIDFSGMSGYNNG